MDADFFDVEIFDRFGIGEVLFDTVLSNFFEESRNEISRVIVGGAKEGNDGDRNFLLQEKSSDHVGMEEVRDDGVGIEPVCFQKEPPVARNVEKADLMNRRNGDSFLNKSWRELAKFAEGDDVVFEFVRKEGEGAEQHIFASAVSE